MKTTKQFIGQFRLDQENFQFKREDFLLELNNYFLELLEISHNGKPYRWEIFKQVVKQTEKKFWAISNKKVGAPFSKDLWSAFYAIYVVPKRATLFPEIECKIKQRRQDYQKSLEDKTKLKPRKTNRYEKI